MKKSLGLFFFGIFAFATGIGCFSATFNNKNITKVEAATSYLEFTDGVATLGRYPQTITDIDVEAIKANGTLDATTGWYTYQNKEYAIKNVEVDYDFQNYAKFNDGSLVKDVAGTEKAFLVEDLKWQVLSFGDGYANIISTRIIDRQKFDTSSGKKLQYREATIFNFNNQQFLNSSFTQNEKNYLQKFDKSDDLYYVSLPEESELTNYEDAKLEYPSDYAIASNLSGNGHSSGEEIYVKGPYWTKTITIEGNRIKVYWSKKGVTNCVVGDDKIGVRPVVRVAYKGAKGSGETSTSSKSNASGGSVALGLGITFTVLGAGGLIAFFILWSKKHPSGKPPVWIIASLAGSLVISVVGLGCLAGGMTGGAGGFAYGYYVQTGQDSGSAGGIGYVQVGYSAWLIKSDGTASYCSALQDSANASDFKADGYMVGTYKISGSKITITIPERYINNFGTIGGTFTYTIKNSKYLYYGGAEAYHWVRGE